MKRNVVCAVSLFAGAGCLSQPAGSVTDRIPSTSQPLPTRPSSVSVPLNFRAPLTGQEVVPPRDTRAQGQAVFQLSPDGTELSFVVIASNIENVTAAHIHLGETGQVGPNVLFLFGPVAAGGGRSDGVVARGVITAANFINALARQPMSVLIQAIEAGNAYVDVPTNDGVAPAFTGPGDFVTGELRGLVR